MSRFYWTFIITLFLQNFTVAQPSFVKQWDSRFGGTGNDKLSVFQQTKDGGYILGGISSSGANGDKSQPAWNNSFDYWIVKIDSSGHYQWDKRFGGTRSETLKTILQTHDKGYILGGYSNSGISGNKSQANWDPNTSVANPTNDYWIVKTDSLGNMQWDKRFGGIYDEKLSQLIESGDGGYLLGGFSASGISGDKTQDSRGSTDFWIVKINGSGTKQWDRRFGGINNEQLYTICSSRDGGYLLGGYSWSQISGDKSQANNGAVNYCDYWIVKVDPFGNKQWDHRYGGSLNDQLCYSLPLADGGYLLGGYSWSGISGDKTQENFGPSHTSDYWILKIDSAGTLKWDKDFGGIEREDEFGNIFQANDGGFLIGATSYSGMGGNKSENNIGNEQSWIIKTDTAGNKSWDKTILTSGHDEAGLIMQTTNGCYVIANYTNGDASGFVSGANRDPGLITYDYWIAKFCDTTSQILVQCTTPDQTICAGTCIDFTNLSQGYDFFEWHFPGASTVVDTSLNPQNVCYNTAGNFSVSLVARNMSGSDTIVLTNYIHVSPLPQPFSIQVVNLVLSAPQIFAGYQWYYQNQPITGANEYYLVPFQDGNYAVMATDSNGCEVYVEIRSIDVGTDDLAANSSRLDLFPNPATDVLYVFLGGSSPFIHSDLTIKNVIGEKIFEEKIVEERLVVDTKNFAPGLYFIEITTPDKKFFKKFLKL